MRIKEKAREIEELALRKEQLLNVKSSGELGKLGPNNSGKGGNSHAFNGGSAIKDEKTIDETLEVNEMLIDAIKAKLSILDDIN